MDPAETATAALVASSTGADDRESASRLGDRVGSGAAWTLLNNLILRVGTLASGIVLARILSPDDYGIYAVALVALTLLFSLNELGVSLALVRWDEAVRGFAPTVMSISLLSSTLLYSATFALAPLYCDAMGAPDATFIVRLLCISVLLDGVAAVPVGILNRLFLQRKRLYSDLSSFALSTGTTIGLAAGGAGPVSFAWGRLVGDVVATVACLALCPIKIRPGWNALIARRLLRFGTPLAGASLLVLATSSVDNLIVGSTLSTAALGLYVMAFNLSSWPLTLFSEAARRVSLAGLSRLAGDLPALNRSLYRGVALLSAATVPVCVILSAYAEQILQILYGRQWTPASSALMLLAALGFVRVILFVFYDLMIALERSRELLLLQGLWLVCMVPAISFGAHLDGIRGAAAGHVLVAGLIVLPVFLAVLRRQQIRLQLLMRALARPLLGGSLMAVVVVVVNNWIDGAWPQLLIGGISGLAAYASVVWPVHILLPAQFRRPQNRGLSAGSTPLT